MALFSARSERQFCERLEYDPLFQWFLALNIIDRCFNQSVFSKDKQRLLDAGVAREFSLQIVEPAREHRSAIDRRTTRHEGYRRCGSQTIFDTPRVTSIIGIVTLTFPGYTLRS